MIWIASNLTVRQSFTLTFLIKFYNWLEKYICHVRQTEEGINKCDTPKRPNRFSLDQGRIP